MKAVLACSVALAQGSSSAGLFEEFLTMHGKEYLSAEEKERRFSIFQDNMKFVEETNSKGLSYKLGMTPFADLTFEEFRAQYIGGFLRQPMENVTIFEKPDDFVMEDDVDWVEKGAVTDVQNQGHCGSCWTFSTTGALEGAMKVAGHEMVKLSEQEILDCDTGLLGGHGCSGGNPLQAMGWVKSNGICSEADLSYKCSDPSDAACSASLGKCVKCDTPALKGGSFFKKGDVTGYSSVATTESALEAAVARQPISVAIEADQRVFQLYKGGVLGDDACGQSLDHAVLAVGYGVEGDQKYWKVKNSWSSSWGEKGYIRLARGKEQGFGECGIRHMASFPTVAPATIVV